MGEPFQARPVYWYCSEASVHVFYAFFGLRGIAMNCRINGALSLALFCLLLQVGCTPASNLIPASGKITVDGQPAEGAVLLFHPVSGASTSISSAVAGADGTFSPVTNSEPGIPAGSYKVTVTWPDPSVKPSEREMMMGTAEPGPDLLKGRFNTKEKSTVTVDISSGSVEIPVVAL